jgi:UDP-glucose 4-epimerase
MTLVVVIINNGKKCLKMRDKNLHETILVTGGAGFIGSHTLLSLIKDGHTPIIIDNLQNGNSITLDIIKKIVDIKPKFYEGDVRDRILLKKIFNENKIDVVIHFAGLKSVQDSVANPKLYYENNVIGTSILLDEMKGAGVSRFIFSSSATVYGEPNYLPIDEEHLRSATNPYGDTKLKIEDILISLSENYPKWSISILRYFNPIGAHNSGLIGEDPKSTPQNLMPFLTNVALGNIKELKIYGNDYPTPDGTGIRDYIHVMDLAEGHVAALSYNKANLGIKFFNLGTGEGTSVLELLETFEEVNKVKIPYSYVERRPGDVFSSYADVSKAKKLLNWEAKKSIRLMCEDSWRWQTNNPHGY